MPNTDGIKTHDYVRYVVAEDDRTRVDDEDGYLVCRCADECVAREVTELRDFYYQNVNAYEHHLEVIQELVSACEAIMPDLDHYVATHGPGPDRRRDALTAALKLAKEQ